MGRSVWCYGAQSYLLFGTAAEFTVVPVSYTHLDVYKRQHISFPEEEIVELRRRIVATRWPERELVSDATQGVQLATAQKLAHYWATDHDWYKCEARLNALPQFITSIDGLDIHFIHVRSKHPNPLPMIITHGWPGSIIEQLKVCLLYTSRCV